MYFDNITNTILVRLKNCLRQSAYAKFIFILMITLFFSLSGVLTLILHIAISDLLTLTLVSVPEMWSHHIGNWTFGKAICIVYLGCEVFAGTSCIYFLIAMNLHALATANGAKNASSNDSETQLLGEMKSSQHSLVSRSGTSTPTKTNEDDTKVKSSIVPVAWPVLFVWILSASLSIPEFPLSTVIDSRSGISSCTLIGGYHLTNMRILLFVFQTLLPFIILSSTSAMIVYKLWTTKERGEVDLTLKLALFLCCLFLVFSAPRFTLATFYSLWFTDNDDVDGLDRFRSPPLHYQFTPIGVPFVFSFLHFLTPVVKPFAYVYFLLKKDKNVGSRRRQLSNDAEIS